MEIGERLIVAVDVDPRNKNRYRLDNEVKDLLDDIGGLGVIVKFNSYLRAKGYSLIDEVRSRGLRFFADLKLIDIPNTLEFDAYFLQKHMPEFLTVMCCAGHKSMVALASQLPHTKVLGVTILTSLKDAETRAIFNCTSEEGVLRFARMAQDAGLGDLILSPKEVNIVRSDVELQLSLNTPGIRPKWNLVEGDDQSRVLTPYDAIRNGADRIVVGRPITQAKNPRDAVLRTLEEIAQALE